MMAGKIGYWFACTLTASGIYAACMGVGALVGLVFNAVYGMAA